MENYTEKQIAKMRDILCHDEFESLSNKDLIRVLYEGCTGWNNIPSEDVIEEFEEKFQYENERAELLA